MLVQLGALGHIDPHVVTLAAGLAVLVLALHVVLRFIARDADPFILPIATRVNGLGIAEIYRIDLSPTGVKNHLDDGTSQILWTALGIGAAILGAVPRAQPPDAAAVHLHRDARAIVLLLLPLVPGPAPAAAPRAYVWVSVGPLNFQPGEIAKITLAIFFAGFLVARRDSLAMVGRRILFVRLPRARDLGPIIVVWVLALGVIVGEHDLGTGLLLFGMFVAMLYVATGRTSWIVLGLLLAGAGAYAASRSPVLRAGPHHELARRLHREPLRRARRQLPGRQRHLRPRPRRPLRHRPRPGPAGHHPGGEQRLHHRLARRGARARRACSRSSASTCCSSPRGFRIGFSGPDDFGKLLAVGLAFVFALQCFIVIGGVMRVIPETGLTTPFLAAGGSSLVANWMIAALLLRISDTIRSGPRTVI